jgi:hypothetical protein
VTERHRRTVAQPRFTEILPGPRSLVRRHPFSEWKQTFTDPRLCSAIVDRVPFNAHIIETGTDSFRLAQTQEKRRRRT